MRTDVPATQLAEVGVWTDALLPMFVVRPTLVFNVNSGWPRSLLWMLCKR
jgi:hypothetical protein